MRPPRGLPPEPSLPARAADLPALLVVVPDAGPRAAPPDLLLAGLPLLRRVALAAAQAGFDHVLVLRGDTEEAGIPHGPATAGDGDASAFVGTPGRVVLLSERVIPQVEWLRRLRVVALPPEHAYLDAGTAAVVDAGDAGGIIREAAGLRGIEATLAALSLKVVDGGGDGAGRFVLDGAGDADRAERWLLQSLIKPSEGFMSRHVERRASLFLTRRLAQTGIAPNTVTFVSLAIGLASAACFLSSRTAWQITGALAFLLHSILDGCDGELARLKFLQSRLGARLDFWGDNLVHVAVFGAMAVGWSRAAGSPWPLAAGGVAVLATLSAAAVLQRWQGPLEAAGPPAPAVERLVDRLANRDFIYLILLLAWWGHAWWFLVVAAAGIPLFLLAIVAAGGLARDEPRP